MPEPRRLIRRDLILLTALCAVVYATGLTSRGLSNWQESQRVVVAREMQARGDWIVPTINNKPYLAKPPLMYWAQLGLARVFGHQVCLFDLRLTVALAGLAGVLATYAVALRLLDDRRAALWSSLCLATGILYVHSSRIGELDILLVPFVVVAVGAIAAAWRTCRERNRTNLPAVALAALAATGAALTKGPPGLLVIGLAGYGGMALWYLLRGRPDPPMQGSGRLYTCFRIFSKTHPVAVLGLPLLALWAWGRLAAIRIGADAGAAFAVQEAEDNLRLFVPGAPIRNLEAAAYGVGLGSVTAVLAIVWLLRDRRRDTPSGGAARSFLGRPESSIIIAWIAGGLIAFSILGKGVPRYLTPIWPAIAMLGGAWIAAATAADSRGARRLRVVLGAAVAALALAQAWWYAVEENRREPDRTPRDMVAELLSAALPPDLRTDPAELATFEFRTPQIDYYAGRFVQPIGDIGQRDSIAGTTPWSIDDLKQHLAVTGRPMTLFVRKTQPPGENPRSAIDRLTDAGLVVQTIPLTSRFVFDNRRTEIIAARVRLKT